jgi:hypothetical protein
MQSNRRIDEQMRKEQERLIRISIIFLLSQPTQQQRQQQQQYVMYMGGALIELGNNKTTSKTKK